MIGFHRMPEEPKIGSPDEHDITESYIAVIMINLTLVMAYAAKNNADLQAMIDRALRDADEAANTRPSTVANAGRAIAYRQLASMLAFHRDRKAGG